MHETLSQAVETDRVERLQSEITAFAPIANGLPEGYRIGDVEDANVLIQNSLWLSAPLAKLAQHKPLNEIQGRTTWAKNQEQLELLGKKFDDAAEWVERVCV